MKELYMEQADNFPVEGTKWFKNWFWPIYTNYGKSKVLASYFKLLSIHFPKKTIPSGVEYTRRMNLGEFIHFFSGAAGVNLKAQATTAFWLVNYHRCPVQQSPAGFSRYHLLTT